MQSLFSDVFETIWNYVMLSFQSFLVHQQYLSGLKVATGRQELAGVEKWNELAEAQQDNMKHPQVVVFPQSIINPDIM